MAPTVPFILGQLGNPISGNKAIAIWLWHGPNYRFSDLFHRQKIIFVLVDGTSVAPGQAGGSRRGPGCPPLRSCSASLSLSLAGFREHVSSYSMSVISNLFFLLFFFLFTGDILSSAQLSCRVHIPSPHLSSPVLQVIPCYSSYSPEEALIPSFPPQSTHHFKGDSDFREGIRTCEECRIFCVFSVRWYIDTAHCGGFFLFLFFPPLITHCTHRCCMNVFGLS